ncbi:MAG: shikimate kinase [Candidatus Omnitrophica bacterium]|nr:shikimate kinase [Candidatus Omnitrophota bacterium]
MNKIDKNIYLIGFMGTGKTTVAKILADDLGREFRETDEEIEKSEQKKIKDIFAEHGEKYFRQKEKAVLKRLSGERGLIVSCGGGVVIDPENRDLLKVTGTVVCLTASPETIYQRTKGLDDRPLLNVSDPLGKIKELLVSRDEYYRETGHLIIDTDSLNPKDVAVRIKEGIPE